MTAKAITVVVASCACSACLTAMACRLMPRLGLVDRPDGRRKLHGRATPLGGGLAVFFATALVLGGLLLASPEFASSARQDLAVLAGAALVIVFVGVADDRFQIRARHKLIGQLAAAAILVAGGMQIESLHLFGCRVDLGPFGVVFTVFWLLGAMNAINLLDGIDGLAATLGIVICTALAVMAAMVGHPSAGIVALALAGSLLGFLFFNFPPARIFLGDTGSMFIGLIAGVLALRCSLRGPGTVLLAAPLAVWTIPILDSVMAILRRKLAGRSISTTDHAHLHHRLLDALGTPRRVLGAVAVCCATTALAALAGVWLKADWPALVTSAAVVAVLMATRLFGAAEMALLGARLHDGWVALRHGMLRRGPTVHNRVVRLQGSFDWQVLWETLAEYGEKMQLDQIILDLNLPSLHEGFNGRWEREDRHDADRCWRIDLPLVSGGHAAGRISIAGPRNGRSARPDFAQLLDLLEPFEIQIEALKAQRAAELENRRLRSPVHRGVRPPAAAPMRILFFTHYFPPEVNAPASRTYEHCVRWARAGCHVTVVTCAPNCPDGILYEGYRNRLRAQSESMDGIEVVRVWTYLAPNAGTLRRIVNYLSYMASAVLAAIRLPRPDVIVATSPQFFCGWAGVLASRLKRRPLVLEIRDIWPESIVAVGAMRNRRLVRFLEFLERRMYRAAAHIVAVGNGYRDNIRHKLQESGVAPIPSPQPPTPSPQCPPSLPSPADGRGAGGEGSPSTTDHRPPTTVHRLPTTALPPISVITNGVDLDLFAHSEPDDRFLHLFDLEGRFVCSYIGTIGMAHGLEVVLEAARLLQAKGRRDIAFCLVGDGAQAERLKARAAAEGLDPWVVFAGRQPKHEIPRILASSDCCLIHLRACELFGSVIPSKLFETLAMGRPIIMGVRGEACEIVMQAGAGIAMEPDSAASLVAAVEQLADHPDLTLRLGRSAREFVAQHYDRTALASRYLALLHQVAGIEPPAEPPPARAAKHGAKHESPKPKHQASSKP